MLGLACARAAAGLTMMLRVSAGCGAAGAAVLLADEDRRTTAVRSARLVSVASTSLFDFWKLSKLPETPELPDQRSAVHARVAQRVLALAHQNGGLYTKFGQHVSSLKYIVPEEYTSVLKTLQDHSAPSPWPKVKAALEQDLAGDLGELFAEFDEEPFACASIAQVHRAKTIDGRDVAVKVQHPGIDSQQRTDITLLRLLSQLVGRIWPDHEYSWLFPELEETVAMELDFVQEALNGQRTASMVQRIADVAVPAVLLEMSSRRVLTMDFIQGFRVDDTAALAAHRIDPRAVTRALLEAHTELLFVQGFFNLDPHPGNILCRPVGDGGGFEVVLLDHGMYRRLDPAFRRAYCQLWCALATRDHDRGRDAVHALGLETNAYDSMSMLLINRPPNSTGALGTRSTLAEKEAYREKRGTMSDAQRNEYLRSLPRDLIFTVRANQLIRNVNNLLGGKARERFTAMAAAAARGVMLPKDLDEACQHELMPAPGAGSGGKLTLATPAAPVNRMVAAELARARDLGDGVGAVTWAEWRAETRLRWRLWGVETALGIRELVAVWCGRDKGPPKKWKRPDTDFG